MIIKLPHYGDEILCLSLNYSEMINKFQMCVENDLYLKSIIEQIQLNISQADKTEFTNKLNQLKYELKDNYMNTLIGVNEMSINHVLNRVLQYKITMANEMLELLRKYAQ